MNYENRDTYGVHNQGSHITDSGKPAGSSQTTGSTQTGPNKRGEGPGPRLMGAQTLIGNSVVNRNGDDLGDIKEIMLDVASGHVSYAVLSFGSFLGMGAKLFAVPWSALTLDPLHKRFILNAEKEHLTGAPGFDPDCWPDMADASWINHLHAFYGTQPESKR